MQYYIVNTLDSIRVNIAIYIQWIVFIGLALAVMAVIAYAADVFAEKRGRIYKEGIESFVSK